MSTELEATEVELPGFVAVARCEIQCLRCLDQGRPSAIPVDLVNEAPEDPEHLLEGEAVCEACTAELGKTVVIPVAIVAGEQVAKIFEDEEDGEPLDGVGHVEPFGEDSGGEGGEPEA